MIPFQSDFLKEIDRSSETETLLIAISVSEDLFNPLTWRQGSNINLKLD